MGRLMNKGPVTKLLMFWGTVSAVVLALASHFLVRPLPRPDATELANLGLLLACEVGALSFAVAAMIMVAQSAQRRALSPRDSPIQSVMSRDFLQASD